MEIRMKFVTVYGIFLCVLLDVFTCYSLATGCTNGFSSMSEIETTDRGGVVALPTVEFRFRQWIFPNINFTCDKNVTGWIFQGEMFNTLPLSSLFQDGMPQFEIWRDHSFTTGSVTDLFRVHTTENTTRVNATPTDSSNVSVFQYTLSVPIAVKSGDIMGIAVRDEIPRLRIHFLDFGENREMLSYRTTGSSGADMVFDPNSNQIEVRNETRYIPQVTVTGVCNSGFTGSLCETNINDCVRVNCSGKGQCEDGVDSFTCSCDPGFTGQFCETKIDECLTMVLSCSGNGHCVDEVNSYSCTCDPGFTGELCEINIDDCAGITCSGNGLCTDGLNTFTCVCNSGFTGPLCETNINDCVGVNCSGNGQCEDGVDSFTCSCDPGFTGEQCNNYYTASEGIPTSKGIDVKTVAISCGLAGAVVFITVLVLVVIMVLFVVNKKHKAAAETYVPGGPPNLQDSKHIEVEANGTTQQTQDDIELKQNIVYGVNPTKTRKIEVETNQAYGVTSGERLHQEEGNNYVNEGMGPQDQPHEYDYVR